MGRPGFYLAVTAAALVVAIYLAFQVIGLLFKLLFLAAAVFVGAAALKAFRAAS